MTTTSTLRNVYDESMYDTIRAASRRNDVPARQMSEYAREARRQGWAWSLIADAMRVSPSTAQRRARSHR